VVGSGLVTLTVVSVVTGVVDCVSMAGEADVTAGVCDTSATLDDATVVGTSPKTLGFVSATIEAAVAVVVVGSGDDMGVRSLPTVALLLPLVAQHEPK